MRVERDGDRWAVAGSWYRLSGTINGPVAILADDGGRWAELRLLASADTRGGADETFDVVGPTVDEGAAAGAVGLAWDLESSAWPTKRLTIDADDATLTVRVTVDAGTGPRDLTTVSLLSGRVVGPRASGLLMSGAWFASLVPGGPGDPGRIVQSAAESTSIGVASGSEPGRGRWFFTPGPFVFAAARPEPDDVQVLPAGPWLSFAIDAVAGQAGFTEVAWRAD
ncbi:MAG TPA: hypothetical protein VFP22_09280, partial [Candidatus Limnocylindrales bacterium]|nr:hypothetical protein [Candidatus Limnocylindrales bacterium]